MAGSVVKLSIVVRGFSTITVEVTRQDAEAFVDDLDREINRRSGSRGVIQTETADGEIVAVPSTEVLAVMFSDRKADR